MLDESGESLGTRLWEWVTLPVDQQQLISSGGGLRRLLVGQTVTGATMAFRSTMATIALPLPTELELGDHLYLHDGWIAVLAFLLGRAVVDPTPFVGYRQHPQQVTRATGTETSAPEVRDIASNDQLRTEWARTHLVLGRLTERGVLPRCRAEDRRLLGELETFQRARTLPPGRARVEAVLREVAAGRYARYARGLRTALGDLVLPRGPRKIRRGA